MALQNLRSSTPSKRPDASSMSDGQIALNTAAASAGLFFKDSNGDLVKTGPVHIGTTAPNSTPATGGSTGNSKGEAWLDTSNNNYVLKIYDGTAWQSVEIAPGSARQLLQTNAAGTDVEFTSNVDVPGTLDVTGATTLDSTASVAGLLSADGKISFAEGNAAAPGIYPGSDTDTGISSPSLDTLSLSTAGASRLYIDSSGDVGIGSVAPTEKLTVSDTNTTVASFATNQTTTRLQLKTGLNSDVYIGAVDTNAFFVNTNGSERLRIDSSGNVGIGVSTPIASLQIESSDSQKLLITNTDFNQATSAGSSFDIGFGATSGVTYTDVRALIFGRSDWGDLILQRGGGSVGIGTSSPGATLDVNGSARIGANDTSDAELQIGSGATGNRSSYVDFIGDLTYTDYGLRVIRQNAGANANSELRHRGTGELSLTTEDAAAITFRTNNGERARITSSGNVGVGTSSPNARFEVVNSSTSLVEVARFRTEGNTNNPLLRIQADEANAKMRISTSGSNASDLSLGAGNFDHLMIKNTSGNVGIGTSSPSAKLDVELAALTNDTSQNIIQLGDGGTGGAGITLDRYQNAQNYGLSFFTTNGTASERLRITNSGDVGIGTISPTQKLQLAGGSIQLDSNTGLAFGNFNTRLQADVTGLYVFYGNATERIRISAAGELFVGASSGGSSGSQAGTVKARAYNGKAGYNGTLGGNVFNINWTGSVAQLWIDTTNVGTFSFTSDYRVKNSVASISSNCIDRIKQLRPVQYQYTDYQDIFIGDNVAREGFIAHEVAEVIPSGVDGAKDDPDQMQSLKVDAILSVTVKALQEAVAKIEALEQRLADAGL